MPARFMPTWRERAGIGVVPRTDTVPEAETPSAETLIVVNPTRSGLTTPPSSTVARVGSALSQTSAAAGNRRARRVRRLHCHRRQRADSRRGHRRQRERRHLDRWRRRSRWRDAGAGRLDDGRRGSGSRAQRCLDAVVLAAAAAAQRQDRKQGQALEEGHGRGSRDTDPRIFAATVHAALQNVQRPGTLSTASAPREVTGRPHLQCAAAGVAGRPRCRAARRRSCADSPATA